MSIEVARGTASRIVARRDGFVVQVQRPSDPDAAADALGQLLANLHVDLAEGPSLASGVFRAPAGPFVLINGGDTPTRLLRKLPDVVVDYLVRAGVVEAVVTSPPQYKGPLSTLLRETEELPSVCLRLYPPAPRLWPGEDVGVPSKWFEEARDWLTTGLADDVEVLAEIQGVGFTLTADSLPPWWEACQRNVAVSSCVMAHGVDGVLRGANGMLIGSPTSLAFTGGRPEAEPAELVELFGALRELARRLAPEIGYALVSFDSNLRAFARGFHDTPWWTSTLGAIDPTWAAFLSDEIVFDAFAYQILGPGHLARLGGAPAGSVALAGGRVELPVGDPAAWVAAGGDPEGLRAQGREVLRPCLLQKAEIDDLRSARRRESAGGSPPAPAHSEDAERT